MPKFKTLDDLDVAGKRVLVRVDLNVPMHQGLVADTTRIERILPTIRELKEKKARIILISHFGRPRGRIVREMSLRTVARAVQTALGGEPVAFAEDCIGPVADQVVRRLKDGDVAVLENLRFHSGEEANDPVFARQLAAAGQAYVNDAFSASHRAHASVEAITRLLPSAAGRLMEAEIAALTRALERPERPLMAIIGGAKVSTKLDLLGNLSGKVDMLAIGGGMANTFLHAMGRQVGNSLCEHDMADTARSVLAQAKAQGCEIVLPTDAVVAAQMKAGAPSRTVAVSAVPADGMILDVGPETVRDLDSRLERCRTLVWNGPLGAFEGGAFAPGTTPAAQTTAPAARPTALIARPEKRNTTAAPISRPTSIAMPTEMPTS